MQTPALQLKVYDVLSGILGIPREQLTLDSSRKTIEEWDSLKHMYVMLALEEEFQIEFTDGEIASLDRVSALVEALVAKTAGTAF